MKQFLLWVLLILLVLGMLIYLMGKLSDSRTNQIYARAHLTEVKSDARLDFMGASMPYVVMVGITAVAAVAVTLVIALIVAGGVATLTIMRHYDTVKAQTPSVMILQIQGGSRREAYRMLWMLSDRTTTKIINVQHK